MPIIGIVASSGVTNTPPVTSGLTHWYDGSDSSTMTVSNGNISQWNTKSPSTSGVNVTQATGARQPDLELNVRRGLSAVRFKDANLDNLKSTTQPTTGTSPFTVCIAGRSTGTGVDQVAVSWGTSNAVGYTWWQGFYNNNIIGGQYAGGSGEGVQSTSAYNNTWFTQVITASSSSVQGWLQNEAKKTATTSTPNIANNSEFFLGWLTNPWYETNGYDGHIGDLLIYNRVLTDAEAVSVRNWLQRKWGV